MMPAPTVPPASGPQPKDATPKPRFPADIGIRAAFYSIPEGNSTLTRQSPVSLGDRQELVSLQACATDQRAVDVRDPHQLPGVARLHRAALEDADAVAGAPEATPEMFAN